MLMFRSRKAKVEYVVPEFYKDWGNAHAELESLGHRLDAVRGVISELVQREVPEDHWGLRHWREVEAVVLRRWKHTVRLKDTGLRQKSLVEDGPKIDYDWFEKHDGLPGFGITDRIFEKYFGRNGDFDWSWQKAIEKRIEMARKGLA